MKRTLVACEMCDHVQIGRVGSAGSIVLSTDSATCGACGGTSFRTYEDALTDK